MESIFEIVIIFVELLADSVRFGTILDSNNSDENKYTFETTNTFFSINSLFHGTSECFLTFIFI